jgi:hypothetical protein
MLTSHTADLIQRTMYQRQEPSLSFRGTSLDHVQEIDEKPGQCSVTLHVAANTSFDPKVLSLPNFKEKTNTPQHT